MRYNTDTPFTQEDIDRFNRLTHYPKSLEGTNGSFAEASRKERAEVVRQLAKWGVAEIPEPLERALERLRKARYLVTLANIRSRELAPPWTVTGPSGWSKHARPERAHRVMGRAYEELNAAKLYLAKKVRQGGPSNVIRSDDANAIEQLTQKIEDAKAKQEHMVRANRIIRSKRLSPDEKVEKLAKEEGLDPALGRARLQPDFCGRIGYADYELTNNGANIRRMEERLEGLKREEARETIEFEFPGGKVVDSAEAARVQIYHDEKPKPEVIEKLKSNGFHWTPSLGCWQRLRNNNARHAVVQVIGIAWPKEDAPEIDALAADRAEEAAEGIETGEAVNADESESSGTGVGI